MKFSHVGNTLAEATALCYALQSVAPFMLEMSKSEPPGSTILHATACALKASFTFLPRLSLPPHTLLALSRPLSVPGLTTAVRPCTEHRDR